MYVIRKQLYIEPRQDDALKRRSRELGVSEAELVRRALDSALAGDAFSLRQRGQWEAAERLLATMERIARTGAVEPEAYDREAVYEERMASLDRSRP